MAFCATLQPNALEGDSGVDREHACLLAECILSMCSTLEGLRAVSSTIKMSGEFGDGKGLGAPTGGDPLEQVATSLDIKGDMSRQAVGGLVFVGVVTDGKAPDLEAEGECKQDEGECKQDFGLPINMPVSTGIHNDEFVC